MRNKICRMFIMCLILLFALTGCSHLDNEKMKDEPVMKLSSDYAVGQYVYKDGKEYYMHQNKLVEHEPDWKMFSGKTEVKGEEREFAFQWYEESGEIIISSKDNTSTYYFENIDGCTSYALLILQTRQSSDASYKLCNLLTNSITSLFEGSLEAYAVDDIQLSPDLSYAIVSADKGEMIFIYDGEKTYPLYELVNGDKEKLYGARFVDNQILILESEKSGDFNLKSAYLYDCKEKIIKKTVDRISIGEQAEERQKGKYIYYSQDGIFKITNLMTGKTVDSHISYDDLYHIYILLDEKAVVVTNEGNILLLDSESGDVVTELETGLELKYSDTEENYTFGQIKSDEGIYVTLYKLGTDILIYKLVD